MRHLKLILLATLTLGGLLSVTAAASPPEHAAKKADTYNTYSLRGCWVAFDDSTGPPRREGHACLKIWYKRQEDGVGMNIKTRRIGMWTQNRDGSISDSCGAFFNNPAVKYSTVSVFLTLSRQWGPATSEPSDGNGCAVQWNTDVGVNGPATTKWQFRPDIDGGFDGSERLISLTVAQDGSWDCNVPGGIQANCDRQGPL